jgi:hypothetical protein
MFPFLNLTSQHQPDLLWRHTHRTISTSSTHTVGPFMAIFQGDRSMENFRIERQQDTLKAKVLGRIALAR